jgi:hypothetical protein
LGNGGIAVCDIALNSGISAGSVEKIIHKHLTVQEGVCAVHPKYVNIQPEGANCCCVH